MSPNIYRLDTLKNNIMIFPKGFNPQKQAEFNGSMEITDRLLSANHLLMSMSSDIMQQVDDIMERNQLKAGSLKKAWNVYQKACDKYMDEFSSLIKNSGMGDVYRKDLQEIDEYFRKWAHLTKEDFDRIRAQHLVRRELNEARNK